MRNTLLASLVILILGVSSAFAQEKNPVCKTRRNAPPSHSYFWPPNSTVKVHFVRDMFTAEQRLRLYEAMNAWSEAAGKVGANVKFIDAGETELVATCDSCLTVTRSEVYKQDRKHYAFFYPLRQDNTGLLVTAWIDFDFATTGPKALQGYMSHELGHGMGLLDCVSCGKKQTIMRGFGNINRDNGLTAPSDCDLEVMRQVYELHKRSTSVSEGSTVAADLR